MTLYDLKQMVDEAIESGGKEVEDMEVYAACDYGDMCHTQQLVTLGELEDGVAVESGYSQSGLALRSGESDEEGTDIMVLT